MFTGVIKLAQIDDYIAPSQNCIQPQIMKNDKQKEKATVTLNDCLACSGCITSAESILIQQMSINKFISMVQNKQSCQCKQQDKAQKDLTDKDIIILISPQSLLSLAKKYKVSLDCFLHLFSAFLQGTFGNRFKIFDLHFATQICHELIFQQFTQHLTKKQNKPLLCSQCPGWVCYAQKTLTEGITNSMSKIKSPQQILGRMIKEKFGNNSFVVSIMPCYDKKLEAIRFQIQQNIKEVDLTLATVEIVDLMEKYKESKASIFQLMDNKSQMQIFQSKKYEFTTFSSQISPNITFQSDQSSNGYIDVILKKCNIQKFDRKEIRNADFQEYTFNYQNVQIKVAKCYGFRNIQKIIQAAKKNKCVYKYVQIMACPGGCFSGGGQVRYQQVKNKEITQQFSKTIEYYKAEQLPQKKISAQNYLKTVVQMLIKDKNGIQTNYKPIQKSLQQSIMNW